MKVDLKMATYSVEIKQHNYTDWAFVDFAQSLDAARKEMARLTEEYWIRQTDRDEDEAATKPKVLGRIAAAEPGEEISTDFCDGWELRIAEEES